MFFNCPEKVTCPSAESVVSNYSSERPDKLTFLGHAFPNDPGGNDNNGDPPLNSTWTADGCLKTCSSTISQEDADLCAQRQSDLCINEPPNGPTHNDDGGDGGTGGDYHPPRNPDNPSTPVGNDPQTCNWTCPSGSVFSYTVPADTIIKNSKDLANAAAESLACNQAQVQAFCVNPVEGWACARHHVSAEPVVVVEPAGVYSIKVVGGTVPPGLELFQEIDAFDSAIFIGIPTTPGSYSYVIQADKLGGGSATVTGHFDIVGIVTPTLPTAFVTLPYSNQLVIAGADGPFTFSILDGALPTGLSLSSSGLISGIPGASGNFQITVSYFNAEFQSCRESVDITVLPAPSICPDWSTLFWGPDLGSPGGAGTQNTSPTNAPGATFHLDASIPGIFDFAGGEVRSTIAYNGPGCNCNLHFSWTENKPHAGAVNFWGISVDVRYGPCPNPAGWRNGTDLLGCTTVLFETNAPTSSSPQTIDLPFTIPDTGGSTMYIWLEAFINASGATAGLYTVSMDGTFSNI